ncbi:ferredoxin [Streptomyces sp. SHP 1-2]|nr:ferredoxin [Streptomyces sp. SHP 1-2]MCW5252039.1 ferredoxin [Streptomyces sp. SHP 1-2]
MRVAVDRRLCCGAGMCALSAPEVFDQCEEGLVVLLAPGPPATLHAAVREAADQCPCSAITLHPAG